MKIIDLLNKIAKGEEVPEKIKYDNKLYTFDDKKDNYYKDETTSINWDYVALHCLNEKVEILEEEKKIPEKLDVISWDKCIHGVTHKEKELAIEINKTQELLNQVLDYLKSKGE